MRLIVLPLVFAAFLTACRSKSEPIPARVYGMGEKVTLGSVTYTVFETQYLTQLGEGAAARTPKQRFLLVRLNAANNGATDVILPAFTIEDDAGNSYSEATGDDAPQWIGRSRALKPGGAVQGNALFDAPPKHYRLHLHDENGERDAIVDMPLSFGSDATELPLPTGQKK